MRYIPKGGGRVGLPGTELEKKREQLGPGKKKKLQMLCFWQECFLFYNNKKKKAKGQLEQPERLRCNGGEENS